MGIDCLTGVDPVQDQIYLKEVKKDLGSQICIMGGVNSVVMLSQWNYHEICKAINEAFDALATEGGFILYPVDAIFNTQPWEKVQVLIDEWRKLA